MQLLKAATQTINGLLPSRDLHSTEECRQRNDRQSYFHITRQLVSAQFVLADGQLSARLWQEVADRDLSIDRITHLLYGCWFHDDDQAMVDADEQFVVA